jgi:hypothetical protein
MDGVVGERAMLTGDHVTGTRSARTLWLLKELELDHETPSFAGMSGLLGVI